MADSTVAFESIAELSRRMRAGTINSATIVEELLDRIALLDERLHSFIRVAPERALADARAADLALQANPGLGPLHGVPYAVKDLFDVDGVPTTAGTSLRATHTATSDCTAVKKLATAGMPLLGKTHTIQFAFGMVGVNHDQGTPLNPWHSVPHAPGGSSSGSAVAVAAGLVPLALGTDTGGSVRLPAAFAASSVLRRRWAGSAAPESIR